MTEKTSLGRQQKQVRDDSRNRRGTTDNAFRKTQILLIDLLTDLLTDWLTDLLIDLLTYAIAKTLLSRFIAPHLLRCAARSPPSCNLPCRVLHLDRSRMAWFVAFSIRKSTNCRKFTLQRNDFC
jgi:hypothetical protein